MSSPYLVASGTGFVKAGGANGQSGQRAVNHVAGARAPERGSVWTIAGEC